MTIHYWFALCRVQIKDFPTISTFSVVQSIAISRGFIRHCLIFQMSSI